MDGKKVVRHQQEWIRHQTINNDVARGVTHTLLSPFSFITFASQAFGADIHVVPKVEKTITFCKENGGILDIDYKFEKEDFKKYSIEYVLKTEDVYKIRVKLWDAWNSYSTNAIIEFIITER